MQGAPKTTFRFNPRDVNEFGAIKNSSSHLSDYFPIVLALNKSLTGVTILVWTHFLVKAMNGDASSIYERGILFSSNLQSYLNKNVYEYVKLNTEDRDNQVPIVFGSFSDKFIIADLRPIFEERQRIEDEKVSLIDIGLNKVSMEGYDCGLVKKLPGFIGGHTVPKQFNSTTNNFIKKIGDSDIQEEISGLSKELKDEMEYTRKQIKVESDTGEGSIITPDFTYTISISLDPDDTSSFIIQRQLTEIANPSVVASEQFNSVFKKLFNRLVFRFAKGINIEELIDKVESLPKGRNIKVDYDPSDLSECTLQIVGLNYTIKVEAHQISIISDYSTEPRGLIEAFKETRRAINQNSEIKFID